MRIPLLDRLGADSHLASPASGDALSSGVTVFHDASALDADVGRHDGELRFAVDRFDGTYLSLAIGLDDDVLERLHPGGWLAVEIGARVTRPQTVFLRLNVERADGTQVLHEIMVLGDGERSGRLNLDALDDRPVRSAWLDVILSHPRSCEIRLTKLDLVFEAA